MAANSARLTNPNDRPQRRSTETFGIAHALCGAVFLCPKRNGRRGSVSLRGRCCEVGGRASRSLRACVGAAWGSGSAREGCVAVWGRAEVFGGEWVVRLTRNTSSSLRACVGAAWGSGSLRREWVVRSAGVHRAACGRASGLRGRASALRGGAEVLGTGVSLCGGERKSSAGSEL